MVKDDYRTARNIFDVQVKSEKDKIKELSDEKEVNKRLDLVDAKVIHTMEVVNDGEKVLEMLGANESVLTFGKIALLNHDIGRFTQARVVGDYKDGILGDYLPFKDHGELGDYVLSSIISKQLPNDVYARLPIRKIVRDHVSKRDNDDSLYVLKDGSLTNYDIRELLVGNDKQGDVINSMTQVVQDVDRLDIYHQILDGRWNPKKSDEPVSQYVLDKFFRGEYLDMKELSSMGLWNPNVGELVRLTFINSIKLLSVAKYIKDEDLIMKLKIKRNNPFVDEAFDYANEKLLRKIASSPDGIITGNVKSLL